MLKGWRRTLRPLNRRLASIRLKIRERLRDRALNEGLARRDKAEAELRISEAKFRGVLAASPDAVIIVSETGVIEFASDRVTDIFGYSPDELAGKPLDVLVPAQFGAAHFVHLRGYFDRPKTRMMGAGLTLWGRRKDGVEFPAEISLSPIAFADRNAAIAAVRDVSSRKALEALNQRGAEALHESEERLRFFVKYSPAAMAMLDTEMHYLVVSDRWLADYGLIGRDLRGLSHYDVFADVPNHWRQVYRVALTGETVHSKEESFPTDDGGLRWLKWEVRPWRDACGDIGVSSFSPRTSPIASAWKRNCSKHRRWKWSGN